MKELKKYLDEYKRFPTELDAGNFLEKLFEIADKNVFDAKSLIPLPIGLIKFSDDLGFYCVDFSKLPNEDAMLFFTQEFGLPFIGGCDKEAISNLKEELNRYNCKIPNLFEYTGLKKKRYHQDINGLLTFINLNAKNISVIRNIF